MTCNKGECWGSVKNARKWEKNDDRMCVQSGLAFLKVVYGIFQWIVTHEGD